jgi:hypothetical protein
MSRPQGTPGTWLGTPRLAAGQIHRTPFDAILDRDGLVWHSITEAPGWIPMPGWSPDDFTPGDHIPEWVPLCPHERICDTETDCVRLLREEPRE